MTIFPGSLMPVLGPMRCQSCGRLVVWGVAVQLFRESQGVIGQCRRRDLYDVSTDSPHRCAAMVKAA